MQHLRIGHHPAKSAVTFREMRILLHRDKLKALRPQSPGFRRLERLLEERREFVDEQRRITNRLICALKDYYPQANAWFDNKATVLFCDFLSRWPTLKQLKRAHRETLVKFFHAHRSCRPQVIEARLAAIEAAIPLTEDPTVIEPKQLLVECLVEQLRATLKAVARFDAEIEAVAPTLPDYALFQRLPGAGRNLAPRLLVAFGEQRDRYASAVIDRHKGATDSRRNGASLKR